MSPNSFTGTVGYCTSLFVLEAATKAGLLIQYPGTRFRREMDGFGSLAGGHAARFAATESLLDMAARHRVTAVSVARQFPREYPKAAARIAQPLTIAALETRAGGTRMQGGALLLPVPKTARAKELAAEVRLANVTLSRASWAGCQPPRMYRAFRHDFTLGGRWIVAGAMPIQGMSKADRLRIRISGEAAAEVDATASHLAILAASAGGAMLPPDPYALPDYRRAVVKQAVVAALGIGRLPGKWPASMLAITPELADVDLAPLIAALAEAYPFLAAPGPVLGVDRRRVALRLQAIEAEALTQAMLPLWRAGVPVVPVHDSLLVPAPAAEWAAANLVAAYAARCGANIRVTRQNFGC
jgi:hypothetical protein